MDDGTVGVYVHVPFCDRVCPYCDFAVVAARPLAQATERRYVDAVGEEIRRRRDAFAGRRLASLYLGGGTPSLLGPDSVARIVGAVRDAFPAAPEVEVTLEVNPSTVERERLPGFRAAGVGRVSVGVQSFDDTVLKRLGRAHGAAEARLTLRACREAGFDSVSVDLLFAAPGQQRESLDEDLAECAAFAPDHVSTYELTIESGTPFETAHRRGQLDLPDEATAAAMMEQVESRLAAAGLARYEISNYAAPGREAVHNRRYWERLPVLGVGPSAHSYDPPGPDLPHGSRRANVRPWSAWLARIEGGDPADAAPAEGLEPATARGEAVFLALRTRCGLDPVEFAAEFGAPPRRFFAAEIEELAASGLLGEDSAGRIALTPRGRLLADTAFERFVAPARSRVDRTVSPW